VRGAVRPGGGKRAGNAAAGVRPGGRRAGAVSFFGSSVRREDQVGDLLEEWSEDELEELEEIQTSLPADKLKRSEVVPVRLQAAVSEVGTLELTAIPTNTKSDADAPDWKVSFNTRGSSGEAESA
jgi:hypothetical protein